MINKVFVFFLYFLIELLMCIVCILSKYLNDCDMSKLILLFSVEFGILKLGCYILI